MKELGSYLKAKKSDGTFAIGEQGVISIRSWYFMDNIKIFSMRLRKTYIYIYIYCRL